MGMLAVLRGKALLLWKAPENKESPQEMLSPAWSSGEKMLGPENLLGLEGSRIRPWGAQSGGGPSPCWKGAGVQAGCGGRCGQGDAGSCREAAAGEVS